MTKFNAQDSARYNQVAGLILKSNTEYKPPEAPAPIGQPQADHIAAIIKKLPAGQAAKEIIRYTKENNYNLYSLMEQASLEMKLKPVLEKTNLQISAAKVPAEVKDKLGNMLADADISQPQARQVIDKTTPVLGV